jgi:putative addiction module killer protein
MSTEKELRNYVTLNGKEPFEEWLKNIKDKMIRARIRRRLDRLSLGYYGDTKALGDGICELRLSFGAGYRIYFAEIEGCIILLLCGGDKSSQAKDIARAKQYWKALIERSKS